GPCCGGIPVGEAQPRSGVAGVERWGQVPGEYERIASIDDPFALLRAATERLARAQQEVTDLARLRRRVIQDLHAQGLSYAQIAEQAGLSRGRIHQIRHTDPASEGTFPAPVPES